ncbi:MAG TPA: HDOD domain-containing protein [Dermatophilaceae bacterium]|nr:HDOD domain-containing protein [Dermatophilaceae bacterium]
MINVLFVDDDAHVLAGIRRSMRPLRNEWRMRCASSGDEALRLLQEAPVDVVVSDMRMPEMDGQAFLCQVRELYPGAVRIVLSGQTDLEAALASVGVSHRFLDKPCDPDILAATVRRLLVVRDRVASTEVRSFVGAIGSLPATPSIIEQLNSALLARAVTNEELVAILERDPAVTAKLLQLANSGLIGTDHVVKDVRTAVESLGLATVRDLITATSAFSAFAPAAPHLCVVAERLKHHSLQVARLAVLIAGESSRQAFSAGILHDIGELIIAAHAPEQWTEVNDLTATGIGRSAAEKAVLGVDHAEIGSYLLALWGLPVTLYEAVAWHHDARESTPWSMAPVHAVFVAESLVDHPGTIPDHLDRAYLDALGLDEEHLSGLIQSDAMRSDPIKQQAGRTPA